MWWKKALKVFFTLGTCYLVGRGAKLKPRDVVNSILIDVIYRKPITSPTDVLNIVMARMIEAGLTKGQAKSQADYALGRIQAQM